MMSPQKSFQKLERKAYLAYHQDGLVDIIIGLCLLGFAFSMAIDRPSIFGWIPVLFYLPLKNRITVPRVGYVRFRAQRRTAAIWVIALLVVGIAMMFGLGVFILLNPSIIPPQVGAWLKQYFMLVLGVIGSVVFLAAGAWTGLKRLYVYGGLTLGIATVGNWLGISHPLYVSLLGALILGTGLWMLARFLGRYPVEEAVNDAQ
jgi:hypothetical protein